MDHKPGKQASRRELDGWVSHLSEAVDSGKRAVEAAKVQRDELDELIAAEEKKLGKNQKALTTARNKASKAKNDE